MFRVTGFDPETSSMGEGFGKVRLANPPMVLLEI
jgi:hypothetical protein